jgi:cytidylate kinase
MPVITISRQFGAGAHSLGRSLAQRLGLQLIDRDVVRQVAEEADVSEKWVEAIERDPAGLLSRMVNRLVRANFIERLLQDKGNDFDERKYVTLVTRIIEKVAEDGDVVVIGRGAQFFLPDNETTIKLLMLADFEDRIGYLADRYKLTQSTVRDLVRREDGRRLNYLKMFHPGNPDDPTLYTAVLNTSHMNLDEAEDLIVGLAGRIMDANASPIW